MNNYDSHYASNSLDLQSFAHFKNITENIIQLIF